MSIDSVLNSSAPGSLISGPVSKCFNALCLSLNSQSPLRGESSLPFSYATHAILYLLKILHAPHMTLSPSYPLDPSLGHHERRFIG
jgi:hypothetical protein